MQVKDEGGTEEGREKWLYFEGRMNRISRWMCRKKGLQDDCFFFFNMSHGRMGLPLRQIGKTEDGAALEKVEGSSSLDVKFEYSMKQTSKQATNKTRLTTNEVRFR